MKIPTCDETKSATHNLNNEVQISSEVLNLNNCVSELRTLILVKNGVVKLSGPGNFPRTSLVNGIYGPRMASLSGCIVKIYSSPAR